MAKNDTFTGLVLEHKESTARQYALTDRAVALGWTRDRVPTIDDDPGKSGPSIEGRPGFQRLLAEVALDRVGLIPGLEMSRLARSCKGWHQRLELCGRYRVLLADGDGVYDPTAHSDRLLLGLHGVMNEAELHVPKQRMCQGKRNKARRGEWLGLPPIGYLRVPGGEWVIDPDELVRAVARLIVDPFDREATMHGLLRYLVHHPVRIPVRLAGGPNKGPLDWRRPNRATLQNLLRHPSYAGAYRFGHRPVDPRKKQPGRPSTGTLVRRPEDGLALTRDRFPADITRDRFEANQARLTANRQRPTTPGPPRNGPAMLAGLVRCGRCGRRMVVRYSGPKNRPTYACTRGSAGSGEPLCQGQPCEGVIFCHFGGLPGVEPSTDVASLGSGPPAVSSGHAGACGNATPGPHRPTIATHPRTRPHSSHQPPTTTTARSRSSSPDTSPITHRPDRTPRPPRPTSDATPARPPAPSTAHSPPPSPGRTRTTPDADGPTSRFRPRESSRSPRTRSRCASHNASEDGGGVARRPAIGPRGVYRAGRGFGFVRFTNWDLLAQVRGS